jgi:small-conductance mechanosensitive channel
VDLAVRSSSRKALTAQHEVDLEMRKFLLAGAAVVALASPAAGATRRHAIDPRDAELAALKAEVDALTKRIEADEAAQRTTAAQAETARQSAAAAQQQATTALTQSSKAEVAAATPVPPLPKAPASGWWGTRPSAADSS